MFHDMVYLISEKCAPCAYTIQMTISKAAALCMIVQRSVSCRLSLLSRSSCDAAQHWKAEHASPYMHLRHICAYMDGTNAGALPDFQSFSLHSKAAAYNVQQ